MTKLYFVFLFQLKTIFYGYAIFSSIIWINTFVILPRQRVEVKALDSIPEDKEDIKIHPNGIEQQTEDEVFITDKSTEDNLEDRQEPKMEKNFTLKLMKSPLVWLLSLQFFLGSLRVYTGTGLMVNFFMFFEGTYDYTTNNNFRT